MCDECPVAGTFVSRVRVAALAFLAASGASAISWLAFGSIAAPSVRAQSVPSFRSVTDAVWVMATVVDREGRLVTDLTKGDFQVVDNGEPRPITVFRNDPLPFALSIMIDISGSMTGNLSVVRRALREMVNQFRPGDRVSVGTFTGTVSLSQRFTARPDTILSLVNTSVGGVGLPCLLQLSQRAGRTQLPPWAGTAVWDAIYCGIDAVKADAETPRRVVMVLTDGMDNASVTQPADVLKTALEYSVMVYAVGMSGTEGLDREWLRALADQSGGGYFQLSDRDDLVGAFARIADELRHQYLFGFSPAVSANANHALVVNVSRPGLIARARQTNVEVIPTGPPAALGGLASPAATSRMSGPASPSGTASAVALLDRYERGFFTVVAPPDARGSNLWNAFREMQFAAPGWIRARGPAEEPRRRLAVATYALELVVAYGDLLAMGPTTVTFRSSNPDVDETGVRVSTVDLVEWACSVIQAGPASPLDRDWYMASIAILERFEGGQALASHLRHAEARVPAEPRWVLANAIALEQQVWRLRQDPGSLRTVSDKTAGQVTSLLQAASALPPVHDEAEVRWGNFELGRGRVDEALSHFARAGATQDRDVSYWLHLFRGRAFEQAHLPAEAVAEYELAVADVPYAQSAALALASALVVDHRAAEAAALVTRMLGVPPPRDPWMIYMFPDARLWDALIATLRRGITVQ